MAFDLSPHRGYYDSDHPLAQADVGMAGVAIDSDEEARQLLYLGSWRSAGETKVVLLQRLDARQPSAGSAGARADNARAAVATFRALGGGW